MGIARQWLGDKIETSGEGKGLRHDRNKKDQLSSQKSNFGKKSAGEKTKSAPIQQKGRRGDKKGC